MEIKLTDKQFEQLQANLIKDALKTISNTPKFIDIKSESIYCPRAEIKQISIPIDKITLLVNLERENKILTEIIFITGSGIDSVLVDHTIDEIKKMIRNA